MAGPKTPPPSAAAPAIPRLCNEEDEEETGAALEPFRLRAGSAPALPVTPAPSSVSNLEPPETVRELPSSGDTGEIPSLADVPKLGDDDGTHTDKTAMMIDWSLRQAARPTLTMLKGAIAGRVFPLEKLPITIGRSTNLEIQLTDAGVSRKHAKVSSPQSGVYVLEDLGSTNGVRVNGVRVQRCELRAGDRVQLGPEVVLQFAYLDDAEESLTKQLYTAATRDGLTSALNRGTFEERLIAEISYARRHKTRLSVIMFDVDHFKRINDTHGHVAGDLVLREIAAKVQRTIRNEDVFARYGGEEFALLVRGETRAETARFAERIRAAVAATEVTWQGKALRMTISLGVAELSECGASAGPKDLIAIADQRLYNAKQSGRNRVCSA